jgi:MoaA/NifB/PqqE/SkfB family radical SAM enzyme
LNTNFHFAFILPTTKCDVRCEHCFYEVGHAERVEEVDYLYPLDEALDQLCKQGLQQVIITGGEPLASPRLTELVELCAAKVVHVLLLTHGNLLTEERLDQLEQAGVDDISISAHRVTADLSRTIQRILFHSPYVPTLLNCLTRKNLDQVEPIQELAGRFNLPLIFSPAFVPEGAPGREHLSLHALPEAEQQELFARLETWAETQGSEKYLQLLRGLYGGPSAQPGFCPMGSNGLVIDADGSVYPCFHRRDLCAGNLIVHPWETIEQNLKGMVGEVVNANCYGEHCVSLFSGLR